MYIYIHIHIHIHIYIYTHTCRYRWKPSSGSNLSVRALRACPLIESRQAILCRAIRGDSISVNSTPGLR